MKLIQKNIIILILILIFFKNVSFSNDDNIKFYVPLVQSDTIDFGMRYEKDDIVIRTFFIENNSDSTYWMGTSFPTYVTAQGFSGNETHRAFEKIDNEIIEIKPHSIAKRQIQFYPNDQLPVDQATGFMDARFDIGVAASKDQLSITQYKKTFYLIGRASQENFDIWDKEIKFDSVFINAQVPIAKTIFFRNNSADKSIYLDSINFSFFTSNSQNEFTFQNLNLPMNLAPRPNPGDDPEKVLIYYTPANRGKDSAIIDFYSTIDSEFGYQSATISGFGVENKVDLIDCSHPFSFLNNKYQIDLGEIPLGKSNIITGTIKNNGNVIFNCDTSFIILNNTSSTINYELEKKFSLIPDQEIPFEIDFTSNEIGKGKAIYQIRTDFDKRNIKGFNELLHQFMNIDLIFTTVSPDISLGFDTLDLGILSGLGDCISDKEFIFPIKNIGNSELEIKRYYLSDPINFNVSIDKSILNQGESSNLSLTFNPTKSFQEYFAELVIITNISKPNDTIRIPIKVIFLEISPSEIKINDVNFKPGNKILVPIISESNKFKFSNKFSANLFFNPRVLKYSKFITRNTASDGGDFLSKIELKNNNELELNLIMPINSNFDTIDTLVLLEFETFLNEPFESNLVIANPKFGDVNCENLYPLSIINGLVQIDSVCGLDLLNFDSQSINIYPNPPSDYLTIEFNNFDKNPVTINLFNYLSTLQYSEKIEINESNLVKTLNISNLENGIYYLEINYLGKISFHKIIITR